MHFFVFEREFVSIWGVLDPTGSFFVGRPMPQDLSERRDIEKVTIALSLINTIVLRAKSLQDAKRIL
jgi:hypothetical protein